MKASAVIMGLLLSFSLMGQEITRGPFLQSARQDGLIIKWRSNAVQVFELKYGLQENQLDSSMSITGFIDFEADLRGLSPATLYYYSITNSENKTVTGSFKTLPSIGASEKLSFVAFGDCGTGTTMQEEVLSQVNNYYIGKQIDGMLLLGDNAYNFGFDREYQSSFFSVYQDDLLRKTVLWPAPGNHDYASKLWPNDFGEKPDYFNIFKLPSEGESGGIPSKTEAYYSFDIGNVHFVSLDSYGEEDGQRMSNLLGKQALWLQEDLTTNQLEWTVVFFHHPPFSKGSHDSDKEQELIDIRTNLVPIFDKYGVDLVLTGHSHNYERSYFLNGFNGTENDFVKETHTLSTSSGKYNSTENSCPYMKADAGTVYLVAGTGGWVGGKSEGYPHNAMYFSDTEETGAVIIEVEDKVFTVKYLTSKGTILDNFVLLKEADSIKELSAECGETLELETNWSKNSFLDGLNESITTSKLHNDTLIVLQDSQNCLSSSFRIQVNPLPPPEASSNSPVIETGELTLISNSTSNGVLSWKGPNNFQSNEANPILLSVTQMNAGIYTLMEQKNGCFSETAIEVSISPLLSNEPSNPKLLVSPNPSNQRFSISFSPKKTGTYAFLFYNLSGKLLYQEEHYVAENDNFQLSLDTQKAGIYDEQIILKVSSGDFRQTSLISNF